MLWLSETRQKNNCIGVLRIVEDSTCTFSPYVTFFNTWVIHNFLQYLGDSMRVYLFLFKLPPRSKQLSPFFYLMLNFSGFLHMFKSLPRSSSICTRSLLSFLPDLDYQILVKVQLKAAKKKNLWGNLSSLSNFGLKVNMNKVFACLLQLSAQTFWSED